LFGHLHHPHALDVFIARLLFSYCLPSYIDQVDKFLLNITAERPWLTADDVKPVRERLDRLKVILLDPRDFDHFLTSALSGRRGLRTKLQNRRPKPLMRNLLFSLVRFRAG
jgi:hypothetical protein